MVPVVVNMAIIQVASSFLAHQEVTIWQAKLTEMMLIKEQIENAVEALPDGLVVVDAELTVRLDNSTTKKLVPQARHFKFQYSKRSYGPEESTLDIDIQHFLRSDAQEVTFGVTKIKDVMCEWKGNAVVWEGQRAAVLIVRDVTELLQLEQTRHETRLKNIMLRSVSHELKTPTNSLIHLLSKAKRCKNLAEDVKKDLDMASYNSLHLNFVIDDLLDYSCFVQGTLTLNKARFNVHRALVKCVKLFKFHSAYYHTPKSCYQFRSKALHLQRL
jgi:K+-sensing histidine kinase KdpD